MEERVMPDGAVLRYSPVTKCYYYYIRVGGLLKLDHTTSSDGDVAFVGDYTPRCTSYASDPLVFTLPLYI